MNGLHRRYDAANEIEKAALFGNPAQYPVVSMAGKDMLEKISSRR